MTPDTNQATEAQTSNISQLSSGIKQHARQAALSIMTALSTLVPSATTVGTVAGAGAIAASTTSCEKDGGVELVDKNKLTPEEEAFAKLLAPNADGTPKYAILEGGVEPYVFKNFAKVNLKLLNAKGMLYEATPVIQKKSVADVLAKAKEMNPGQPLYYISLSLVKKSGSTETVLNGTVFVADKDDNNPATRSPWLDVLPEEFTLDEFNKHNQFANIPKDYILNSGEELIVRMYVAGSQSVFTNFNFGVNPTQKVN
jgi:hypothetical protein